jgi:hypothetical protein
LQKAVDAAVEGRIKDIMPALEMAGMEGQNVARDWFTDSSNNWPPNKGQKDKANKKPLIDTDEMRKSITYVVREVGKK